VDWLLVLGGVADVPRGQADRLLRPLGRMQLGRRVGELGAALARTRGPVGAVPAIDPGSSGAGGPYARFAAAEGNFRSGPRMLAVGPTALPVLGRYQVVVVGGGTGGASAAISAGRAGARTAVLETLDTLGGVGTAGMVSLYYHGNPVGFSQEIDAAVERMAGLLPSKGLALEWVPYLKAEWYRQELRRQGVAIWFGTFALGAVVEGNAVRGVVVSTPRGPGVVLGDVVVDSTGNAAVAAAAGAPCTYTGADEVAVQGTGLPPLFLEPRYLNTDYTYVDETDILDVWRAFVVAREKYASAHDVGQLIDTRERRRIRGDVEVRPTDAVLRRVWPDTVVVARSDFDSHGYTVDPLFLIRQPDRTLREVPLPYRALLPQGWEGILVTGLGISVHRDTLPLVRMQRDIQNQGYAAGWAAAQAAQDGVTPRQVDLRKVQAHLAEKGLIPRELAGATDSFPLSPERLRQAVRDVANDYQDLAVILTDPAGALPLLRSAHADAATPAIRLTYAHILGMLGDPAGVEDLCRAVAAVPWDQGWNFKGMGQYGGSLSRVDSLVLALGGTRDPRALAVLLDKARALTPRDAFSHYRAISLALEKMGRAEAAPVLAALLAQSGVGGHAQRTIDRALRDIPPGRVDDATRGRELRELGLARALYRCGDAGGQGEAALRSYADDLRGHYARHARAVLAQPAR
jgi:hypothetical protein